MFARISRDVSSSIQVYLFFTHILDTSRKMDRNALQDYEDIALSDKQLRDLAPDANLILYPELIKYQTIDDVLGPDLATILLFEAKPGYGHWCCLFRRGNLIEFFNPYGGYPDDSLEHIPMHFREISNQLVPYLSELMMRSPYELSYNEHAFQKHKKDVKTCGRHCAVRLALRMLPLDDYTDVIARLGKRLGTDPDGVVTVLSANISPGS